MSTDLQSLKGSWDTEIKRVRTNAKIVAAEVDDMNDDLKLINECWKVDRDKIKELEERKNELLTALETLKAKELIKGNNSIASEIVILISKYK